MRTTHSRARNGFTMIGGVAAAVVVAITLSGCAASPVPSSTTPPSRNAPDAAGSIHFDAAELTAQFEDLTERMMIAGAAMLVRTPDGEVTNTFGFTELGGTTPVSLDDHIRIGSNTKTWTGTVILQLVQEGKIALDDPVSKYRPDVPNGDNITIEQLLTMRSGLVNYTETYELNEALDSEPDKSWDPEDLVAMGLALPPYFAPGEGWHYSNTNTALLGLIAEKLEGSSLQQIFEERLFAPLGLENTSFPSVDDASLPSPYAHGYMFTTNVFTMSSSKLPPDLLAQAQAGTLLPKDHTDANPSWAWAAGSGISTIGDLATWVEALGGGGLLNEDLQQQRLENVESVEVPLLPDPQYGWGIAKIGQLYGHTGELPGYNSFMGYDPVNDVTIVVWGTLAPMSDGEPPGTTIAVELMKSIYGG
jgi:D-alanyl-D-alanine carboxypeptidase